MGWVKLVNHFMSVHGYLIIYDVILVNMTLCDAVGRLFLGVCKNGAVHHGLFFAGASCC